MKYKNILGLFFLCGVVNASGLFEIKVPKDEETAYIEVLGDTYQDLDISSRVQKELNNQIYAKLRDHAKKSVYGDEEIKSAVDGVKPIFYLYKVPMWPRQARFFLKKDQVGLDVRFKFATQAESSSGATQDISNLVFRECPIRVKDILLGSKLIDLGVAEPTTSKYNFLDILKDQTLSFDASMNSQEFVFSYVRHFLKGDVALGIEVPLVRKRHDLELTSCLSPRLNEELESQSPGFFTTYPNGLIDFFKDILSKKNICFNEKDTEIGLGDISVFFNYEIPFKMFERCVVGVRGVFPTSRRRDIYKLWDPELGNGGFTELAAFGALLYKQSRWLNPHIFSQLTYAFPSTTFRRVPKIVSKDDIESISNAQVKFGEDFLLYGNGLKYVSSAPDFSQLDTCVRHFADCAYKAKINRGGNFFVRIGNMIERVFTERLFLDLYYDFYAKWKDYIGFRKCDLSYDSSLLTDNTHEIFHRIGTNLSWQPDNSWRFHLGGMYTLAGKNTLRLFEINGAVSLQF